MTLNGKRTRDARSSGELPSFPMKERTRARPATIHHRAYLATVCCPVARKGGGSSARLPPPPYSRPSGLREAGVSFGVRLRLPENRRRGVFGYHASGPAQRVDRDRGDGLFARNSARSLRPIHRPGTFPRWPSIAASQRLRVEARRRAEARW